MSQPLTEQQLDDIQARFQVATPGPWERHEEYGPHFFANISGPYLRGVGTLNFGDGEDAEADEGFVKHAVEDVRALLAEVGRLRADAAQKAEGFRALFGNLTVKGQDGDWANVADFIATGARIPACDAFYPHHTDTRCYLAKGHRRNHLAKWGTGDMAWPYDPRETQQPLALAEVPAGTAAPAPPVAPLAASQPSEAPVEGEAAARAAMGRTGDPRRTLTPNEYDAAWHAVEGAAGEEGADPGTVLHAVLNRLGIDTPAVGEAGR